MAISTTAFATQLLAFIGAEAGITSKVVDRYYKGRIRQDETFPAMMFTIRQIDPTVVKGGVSTYDKVTVRMNAYALLANECEDLHDSIRTSFDRFSDLTNAVIFHETFFIRRLEMVQDFKTKIYWIASDYEFHIK